MTMVIVVFYLLIFGAKMTPAEINKIQMKIGGYLCGM
jgi:hypothetical protein